MAYVFNFMAIVIPLFVIGGIGELIAIAVGYLDPWDFR